MKRNDSICWNIIRFGNSTVMNSGWGFFSEQRHSRVPPLTRHLFQTQLINGIYRFRPLTCFFCCCCWIENTLEYLFGNSWYYFSPVISDEAFRPASDASRSETQTEQWTGNELNEWMGRETTSGISAETPYRSSSAETGQSMSSLLAQKLLRRKAIGCFDWEMSPIRDDRLPSATHSDARGGWFSNGVGQRPAEASRGQRRPAEASGGKRRWRRCRFRVGRQQRNKAQKFNRRLTITAGGLSYANSNLMITRKLMNLRQLNMKLRWSGAVSGIWRLNKRTRCSFHAISMLTEWRTMSPPRFHQTLNQRDSNKRAKT